MIGIAAAGTGGHIYAAKALGEYIQTQLTNSSDILYLTGTRPLDYQLFPENSSVIHLDSKPLKGKGINPIFIVKSIFKNLRVFFQVKKLIKDKKITLLIGLGGHVCGPILLAGYFSKIPTAIVEQNSIVGLTNKILSLFATKIFTHFPHTKGFFPSVRIQQKIFVSGNPIRKEFFFLQTNREKKDTFNILVFAGSLGSALINEMIKNFVSDYKKDEVQKICIHHQCKDSIPLNNENMNYTPFEFFNEIWKEYEWADLIIARSGASSCSELYFAQKPIIFIPYPYHKDQHQLHNARLFAQRVSTPVYIHTVEELEKSDFKILREILKKEQMAQATLSTPINKISLPQQLIWEEIKKVDREN